MAPPLDQSERPNRNPRQPQPPPKKIETKIALKTVESENFGFMDAILELWPLLTTHLSLELGRQLRNAQGNERVDIFYRHLISLN
ncbi:hypothetical protein TNCV_3082351 [Trichonephila clavipes]|nr:hypothetical protein TNCV_3082351 [Trichonephila clavipes]